MFFFFLLQGGSYNFYLLNKTTFYYTILYIPSLHLYGHLDILDMTHLRCFLNECQRRYMHGPVTARVICSRLFAVAI